MWESSVPINNENINQTFGINEQLINSYGNRTRVQNNEPGFQTCRSIINRLDSQSDDDQVLSDDDDEQGGLTPKASKRKGPNSFVLELNIQAIHIAANAPSVNINIAAAYAGNAVSPAGDAVTRMGDVHLSA